MKNKANEKKKETKIKSLKSYHVLFAALSLLTMLMIVFKENWVD